MTSSAILTRARCVLTAISSASSTHAGGRPTKNASLLHQPRKYHSHGRISHIFNPTFSNAEFNSTWLFKQLNEKDHNLMPEYITSVINREKSHNAPSTPYPITLDTPLHENIQLICQNFILINTD